MTDLGLGAVAVPGQALIDRLKAAMDAYVVTWQNRSWLAWAVGAARNAFFSVVNDVSRVDLGQDAASFEGVLTALLAFYDQESKEPAGSRPADLASELLSGIKTCLLSLKNLSPLSKAADVDSYTIFMRTLAQRYTDNVLHPLMQGAVDSLVDLGATIRGQTPPGGSGNGGGMSDFWWLPAGVSLDVSQVAIESQLQIEFGVNYRGPTDTTGSAALQARRVALLTMSGLDKSLWVLPAASTGLSLSSMFSNPWVLVGAGVVALLLFRKPKGA